MQPAPRPPLRPAQDDYTWLMVCMASGAIPLDFCDGLDAPTADALEAPDAALDQPNERPWGILLWGLGLWLAGLLVGLAALEQTTPSLRLQANGSTLVQVDQPLAPER